MSEKVPGKIMLVTLREGAAIFDPTSKSALAAGMTKQLNATLTTPPKQGPAYELIPTTIAGVAGILAVGERKVFVPWTSIGSVTLE